MPTKSYIISEILAVPEPGSSVWIAALVLLTWIFKKRRRNCSFSLLGDYNKVVAPLRHNVGRC
jgi:hypothetical protein